MANDYLGVTEVSGNPVSQEQLERIYHRYKWAAELCRAHDVVEVACGSGQGIGVLLGAVKSLQAFDISSPLVDIARKTYGARVPVNVAAADDTGLGEESVDTIILFEALYYLPDAAKFLEECDRVLRPDGQILIATANKDLYDFNPSPYSIRYFGATELTELFETRGYDVSLYGYYPVSQASWRQQVLRPIKLFLVKFGLMPKSMKSKELLKRLVFGRLVLMPAELPPDAFPYKAPDEIEKTMPDSRHKVLYCVARKKK